MSIEPFVHANFALAPNRNEPTEESKSFFSRYLRASTGFGLSMELNHFAIECYYNLKVSK
jgi:hypothetical protein